MTTARPPSAACHNCRRQRLKCDQSRPSCLKCIKRGQQCMGYQRLFRWEDGIASRGKMAGKTFGSGKEDRVEHQHASGPHPLLSADISDDFFRFTYAQIPPSAALTDPVIQDVATTSRKYVFYFASEVCRDLVLYDTPKGNHFRQLIPLTHQHPVLLQIIVANSALHMSNVHRKAALSSAATQRERPYNDALVAKQRAIHLLSSTLVTMTSMDADVALAVVLLFIEFELLDSGRNDWRHHINGARTIIENLCGSDLSTHSNMSPLRSFLISNCLVFDILGSTLSSSTDYFHKDPFSSLPLSLLRDAEGNHCSSFPSALLQLIQTGARLLQANDSLSPLYSSTEVKFQQASFLLKTAYSFDPLSWATSLQPRSPVSDLKDRTCVASAHRAAVCIYLSHIVLSFDPKIQLAEDLETLAADIVSQASFIRPENTLFTATTWPVFIAGAETKDPVRQAWVTMRFRELWEVEPWGVIREALALLETIWARITTKNWELGKDADILPGNEHEHENWMRYLKMRGVDWLIL